MDDKRYIGGYCTVCGTLNVRGRIRHYDAVTGRPVYRWECRINPCVHTGHDYIRDPPRAKKCARCGAREKQRIVVC